jgi:phenylacetate-coenzyme A ligase PaaK-like adenylate-forming protein
MDLPPLRVPDPVALAATQRLLEVEDPYDDGPAELFIEAVRESIRWHAARVPAFAARVGGFLPRTLAECADVPFLLAAFFKKHTPISVPNEDVVLRLTSSGTRGPRTVLAMDGWTLAADQRMSEVMFRHLGWDTPDRPCHYLLLSHEPEPDMGLGAAFTNDSLMRYAPAREVFHALRRTGLGGHEFDPFGAIDALRRWDGQPVRIFGFPAFLHALLNRMDALGVPDVRLHPDACVWLGGGWKGDEPIDRDTLYGRVVARLGVPLERVRDCYGSAEHGVPYVECRRHRHHAAIWSHPTVRDPATFAPVGFGRPGLLHFVTPYYTSMPLVSVLTTDVATLHPGASCGCGIERPYFVLLGRAGRSRNRTCAAAAAELLAREVA